MRYPLIIERSALVTGCSTGIGYATAHLLKARGWRVFPTARKAEDLERLRAEGFFAIELDVASDHSVERAVQQVLEAAGGRLGAVVNNAGFGIPGAIEDLSRDAWRRQFEVNVFGLFDLTRRLIPTFRRQGFGRIVNVGSVVGRLALPFLGLYSASKFAVAGATAALRVELRGTGIAVALIEPGPIETAFRENAVRATQTHLQPDASAHKALYQVEIQQMEKRGGRGGRFRAPPEAVARRILHALESPRPRRRYRITPVADLIAILSRFAPDGLLDAMLSKRGAA